MDLQGVQIQNYIYHFFKSVLMEYPFNGKHVMFLHNSSFNLDNARALLKLGASKVTFVTCETDYKVLQEENITLIDIEHLEQLSHIEDNSVDIAIGLEVLEHIFDIQCLGENLRRVLKDGGVAVLHGYPMWTSRFGHHLWIEDKFYFNDSSNPLKPWAHLSFENAQDAVIAMKKNGFSEEDGKIVADWIFGGEEINRLSLREIFEGITNISYHDEKFGCKKTSNAVVDVYQTEKFSYYFEKKLTNEYHNSYYEKACLKYADLDVEECVLTICKNRQSEQNGFAEEKFPELPYFRRVVFEQFFKKYNLKNAKVLNLSYYDNNYFSQILKNHGAKVVVGVSPRLKFEEVEEITGIENYATKFEDLSIDTEKFDIIIGFDVIQKVKNFDKFCQKLKKYSNLLTAVHIDGYMPYTSACGHAFCSENHKFYDQTNPLDYWEHLTLNDEQDFREALKNHNILQEEIDGIIYEYNDDDFVLKLSPKEIEEKISKSFILDIRKIYKFYPKNEFYYKALEKYSEDDLNIERLIITSDIPHLLWLNDLKIDKNYELSVSDINAKYKLPQKRVLSISPHYCNYDITDGLEALRAEEVVSLGAYYSGYELRCGTNVKMVNQKYEDVANLCGKFDIIYGIEILEHVKDLKKFFENLKNILADKGVMCLQGRPLWTSDDGHNCSIWLNSGFLQTGEENHKISPWQHVAFDNKNDLKKSLLNKAFSDEEAEKISDFVFNSDEVNRHSYAEILDILNQVEGLCYGAKKVLAFSDENEFYEMASKKYTHEELRTKELNLSIRKKLQ